MSDCYATAKAMIDAGDTPIPLNGRKPLVKWANEDITPASVEQWQKQGLWSKNIGVVCGARSNNLVIIDLDGEKAWEAFRTQFPDLLDTHTVKTRRGYHLYYRVGLLPANTFAKDVPQLDGEHIEVRADNVLVTIPPSLHPKTGQPYEIINPVKSKHLEDMVRVCKWVEALDPKPKREFPVNLPHDGNLNPVVLAALREYFMNAEDAKPSGEWINCHCPNPSHKDNEPSFGYNTRWGVGHCFGGCNMVFNTKTLCELTHTDYKALGGLFEPNLSAPNPNGNGMPKPAPDLSQPPDVPPLDLEEIIEFTPSAAPKPATSTSLIFMTDDEAQQALDNEIDGVTIAKHPPLAMPLYFLRQHGIRVLTPGRLCYFASISGGGKTQMMELIIDRLRMNGKDVIVRSDEWISRETHAQDMMMRRIQRHGGPTYQQMALHKLWESEEVLHLKHQNHEPGGMDIPRDKREGVQFTPYQYQLYQRVRNKVNAWPGKAYYLLEQGVSVEKMITHIEATYEIAVSKGRKPVAFFLDYAQLVWMEQETNGKIWIEQAMTQIKDMCGRLGMVGFVFSQLNQNATDQVNRDGEFSPTMMNWLSERQANLVVMWSALKNEAGEYVVEDRNVVNPCTGAKAITPMRTINYQIVKNSFGEPNAKGLLDWNAVSLRIEDARENVKYQQPQMEV